MTIKELERRTGLPRTSIRFYEQEGLLTPERRENNYRNYSEDNVRTLEKIKLLRRLSLDLEAIRRLQAGDLSLSRALAGQALALEGDRDDLERYAQVCEELSRTETSYDDLDPEPWLAALEEKSLPLSRRVDPTEQGDSQTRPPKEQVEGTPQSAPPGELAPIHPAHLQPQQPFAGGVAPGTQQNGLQQQKEQPSAQPERGGVRIPVESLGPPARPVPAEQQKPERGPENRRQRPV